MTIVVNGLLQADTRDLNELSQLALVACDASYMGGSAQVNDPLHVFNDTPQYGDPQPSPMFGFQFELVSRNYLVHARFEDETDLTGFKAVAYRNAATNDVILAFAGTDNLNARDWWSNSFHLGWNQWDKNLTEIQQYVDQFVGVDGRLSVKLHFVGQSLGGALAQYAAYDFVSRQGGRPGFDRAQTSLVTFNALGGVAALKEHFPGFDRNVLDSLGHGVHYVVENDLVHRLGDGHVGGQVRKFHWTDIDAEPGAVFNRLGPVDGHRIETAFYKYLSPAKSLFNEATSTTTDYLKLEKLQKLASALGNLQQKTQARSSEAVFQFFAGLIPASIFAPEEEINGLAKALIMANRDAGNVSPVKAEMLFDINWSKLFRGVASTTPTAAAASYSGAIVLGMIGAAFEESLETVRNAVRTEFGSFTVPDIGDRLFDTWRAQGQLMLERMTAGTPFAREFVDAEQLAQRLTAEQTWFADAMSYVTGAAVAGGVSGAALGSFGVQALEQAGSAVLDVAHELGTGVAERQREVTDFVGEFAQAIANSSGDYLLAAASGLSLPAQDRYLNAKAVADGFLASLRETELASLLASDPQASEELVESEILVRSALQTVVIRPGRLGNPFEDGSFDPEASPLSIGSLNEGSIQTFTVHLPYEAEEGGQRIKVEMAGGAAEKLFVLTDEGDVDLGVDGAFTLTVAEGQREVTFHIAALEDVDTDETLTLSAQLVEFVNGEDVATHREHEELQLALDAEVEEAPVGGMELHGNWGLKLYPVFKEDGTPALDANGNQVFETRYDTRYAPFTNLERDPNGRVDFGEQGALLTGLDGPDHIWLGEFGGAGGAIGGGGDDYFEGMVDVPNLIIGDYSSNRFGLSGDDVIEGGENARPYSSPGFTREGEHIEGIGDDILFGGLGNDEIYADRIELVDETLDPDTVLLDQKGDWITGEQGDDRIFGSAAHDALFGGGGADEIHGGVGNDVLDGDDNYYNWGDAWWEVDAGSFGVTFFPVTNFQNGALFEYYKDFGGGDVLDGGSGDDLIFGMLGEDTLIGGAGEDQLEGWEGDDRLFGGADDDLLVGDFGRNEVSSQRLPTSAYRVMPGGWNMFGSPGMADQAGHDLLDGGDGDDRLIGEASDDILLGGDGADVLIGDAQYLPDDMHGNDLLDGGAGADELSGDAGNDRLFGGADADVLRGGAGSDVLDGGSGEDSLAGDEGDDVLEGEAGDDALVGDAGADVLYGGDGVDQLSGSEGDDVLYGDAGNDELDGGYGADTLRGGAGDDLIYGGDGDDLIEAGSGADVVQGGAGDDTYVLGFGSGRDVIEDSAGSNRLRFSTGVDPQRLSATLDGEMLSVTIAVGAAGDSVTLGMSTFDAAGADFASGAAWGREEFLGFIPALVASGSDSDDELVGNEYVRNDLRGLSGDDRLVGSANEDRLEGGEGGDWLDGRDANDALYGNDGEDSLEGGYGDDVLAGGRGDDDVLMGGEGADTYVFTAGDGSDFVFEFDPTPGEVDALMLSGIVSEGVQVTRDEWSYYLVFGGGDRVTLDSMAVDEAAEIERIDFADGATWTSADLEARVELLPGTELNDALWGTPDDDILEGLGGDDLIYGNRGNDLLIGGQGSDYYYLAAGDGADRIDSSESDPDTWDQVWFADVASSDALLARSAGDLVLSVADGDSVTLLDWYTAPQRRVDEVFFAGDGVSWDAAMLEQLAPVGGGNSAPELAQPVDDHVAYEDSPFGFTVPASTFNDADVLSYEADFASGWLSFDAASRTFSGTPTNDDVRILEVTVTATDPFGESASDAFRIEVRNTNDAPVVSAALDNQSAREGQVLAYIIPEGTFADVDAGDRLTLSAELADGSALPGWLRLEGGQLTGVPGMSDGGDYQLRVVATDIAGASATVLLALTVSDSLAVGNRLIGTIGDDVLNGTAGDEILVGRGGTDRLLAGGGDDILAFSADERVKGEIRSRDFFDGGAEFDSLVGTVGHDVLYLESGSSGAHLSGIEYIAMRAGHDLVDLRSTRTSYGDVILDGGIGHDVLRASGGDDVLLGRSGNDQLSGGAGWDLYVHERLGGHDRIDEAGLEGEVDVLRFGEGITRGMVRVRRQGEDLQLDVSGPNGSVTVEDWFSRQTQRVELVQFADGSAWDEEDIGQLARRARFGDGDRVGREGGADAEEIARQWAAVQRHANALASESDDFEEAGDWQPVSMGGFVDGRRRRSALEGAQGAEGFRSLET